MRVWQRYPYIMERHPAAEGGAAIKLEHELHSLREVLRQFQPCESAHVPSWNDLLTSLDGDGMPHLDELAQRIVDLHFDLELVDPARVALHTGSPDRQQLLTSVDE